MLLLLRPTGRIARYRSSSGGAAATRYRSNWPDCTPRRPRPAPPPPPRRSRTAATTGCFPWEGGIPWGAVSTAWGGRRLGWTRPSRPPVLLTRLHIRRPRCPRSALPIRFPTLPSPPRPSGLRTTMLPTRPIPRTEWEATTTAAAITTRRRPFPRTASPTASSSPEPTPTPPAGPTPPAAAPAYAWACAPWTRRRDRSPCPRYSSVSTQRRSSSSSSATTSSYTIPSRAGLSVTYSSRSTRTGILWRRPSGTSGSGSRIC
mmetsp:Transcript_18260/g.43959  ORF Transcript_18260/g.43959 Transcript_18260/m.43959 type:complete len:260 (+) Transcript_18260:1116-1895(+)